MKATRLTEETTPYETPPREHLPYKTHSGNHIIYPMAQQLIRRLDMHLHKLALKLNEHKSNLDNGSQILPLRQLENLKLAFELVVRMDASCTASY